MLDNLYNLNIERAVLSAIIFDPEITEDVSSRLEPKDFYLPFHQYLFSSMLELIKEDKPIDEEFLKNKLKMAQKFDEIAMLNVLVANPISNWDAYIGDIRERRIKRELKALSLSIQKSIEDKNSEEIKLSISKKIVEIDEMGDNSEDDSISAIADEFEEFMNDETPPFYIPTAIRGLDGLLGGGFETKEVVVIGARPSVGKTAYVTTLINSCVDHNIGVLFHSLEMPKTSIFRRIISGRSDNPLSELKRKEIKNPKKYKEEVDKIKKSTIIVKEKRATREVLKAEARKALRQNPNIKVWIIDHLGELVFTGSKDLRLEIGDMMSDMRDVAKEFDILVVALSQLRRIDKKPTLIDLRESGEIEQKADKVVFLHREDYITSNYNKLSKAEFIVAKNRDGRVGIKEAYLEGEYARFVNDNYTIVEEKLKIKLDFKI